MQILAGESNLGCIYVHVCRKYNPLDLRSHEHVRLNKNSERKNIKKIFLVMAPAGFEPSNLDELKIFKS